MPKGFRFLSITIALGLFGCKPRTFNNDAQTEGVITKEERVTPAYYDSYEIPAYFITNDGTNFTRKTCKQKPATRDNCTHDPITAPTTQVLSAFREKSEVFFSKLEYRERNKSEFKILTEEISTFENEIEALKPNQNESLIENQISNLRGKIEQNKARIVDLNKNIGSEPTSDVEKILHLATINGVVNFNESGAGDDLVYAGILLSIVISENSSTPIPKNVTLSQLKRDHYYMRLVPKKPKIDGDLLADNKITNVSKLSQSFGGKFCEGYFPTGKPYAVVLNESQGKSNLRGSAAPGVGFEIACGEGIYVYDTYQNQRVILNQYGTIRTISVTNAHGELVRYARINDHIIQYVVKRVNTGLEYNFKSATGGMMLSDFMKVVSPAYTVEVTRKPAELGQLPLLGEVFLSSYRRD